LKKLIVFLLVLVFLLPLPIHTLDSTLYVEESPDTGSGEPASGEEVLAASAPQVIRKYNHIPILMYHVLADYSGPLEQLYVSPSVFRRQLEYLQEEGFHTVTMGEVLAHWTKDSPLPEKPIVLTFDDGYTSMFTEAFPILREFGYKGTFYLHTSKINTAGGLTSEMVRQMAESGMEIGCHTVSHPDLTKLSPSRLQREVQASKEFLEELTGSPVLTFAYPSGRYNQKVKAAVQDAGYLSAVTTEYGLAHSGQDPLVLSRLRINKSDGLEGFKKKISQAVPR